jgi:AcrR family transcriptional regulator
VDTRNRIIEAYFEMVLREGFAAVSLDRLSKELGISKKTVYRHFAGKEELIESCVRNVFEQIDERVGPVLASGLEPVEKWLKLTETVAEMLRRLPGERMVELKRSFPSCWELMERLREERIRKYAELFEQGMNDGQIRRFDPHLLAHLYWRWIREITSPDFLRRHDLSWSQALKMSVDLFMNGVLETERKE